ncbi:ABC transporter permease [Thalassotalea hakodatensis]|uniref:ABC transporter permease n=1 Tax=Thalassotalea hakodatensis TaxID=3030492 RepID=UPI002572729A|nr:ABC transporter permease [Thalassotalea hakodatensis]
MIAASMTYHMKQAWQSITRHPMFGANVVATIAITLGALLCATTLIYLMLIKPLPYPEMEKLYLAKQAMVNQEGDFIGEGFSYPAAKQLYNSQGENENVALSYLITDVITSLAEPVTIESGYVTNEWFDLLGATFIVGGNFSHQQKIESFTPGAILSYQLWQEQFGSDPNIQSKSIDIRGISHPIIGVLSPSFVEPEIKGIGRKTQLWLAWDFNWAEQMGWGELSSIDGAVHTLFKLHENQNVNNLKHQLNNQQRDLWQQTFANQPSFQDWQISIELIELSNAIYQGQSELIYYVFFACLGIFFIAMTNITNLFMSRTIEQQRNLAIHAAIGAKKFNLFTLLFIEYGMLLLIALPFVLAFAYLGFYLLQQHLTSVLPRAEELSLSWFSLAFSTCVLVLLNTIFTLVCRQLVPYHRLNNALNQSGKGSGIQIKASVRSSLIAIQITIAATLIFINLAMFNQAYKTINQPMGISVDNLWQLRLMEKNPTETPTETLRNDLIQINRALNQHPEIAQSTISLSPLIWFGNYPIFDPEQNTQFTPEVKLIDDGYFPMLSQTFITGENFTEQQVLDGEFVMVINEKMAHLLASTETVINKKVRFWGRDYNVIGVVQDLQLPNDLDVPPRAYVPDSRKRANIMLKSIVSTPLKKADLLSVVESVSIHYTIREIKPFDDDKHRLLFMQYTTIAVTGCLTILTLFLAIIGLYGILSYSSQLRRHEIGTRLAIGAKGSDILSMMFKENLKALFCGLIGSVFTSSCLFFMFDEQLNDLINASAIIWLSVTLVIVVSVTLIGCYLPIRQYVANPVIKCLRATEE